MQQDKNALQQEVVETWMRVKPDKGTILLPTGVGKTKVACDILRKQFESSEISSALIVVPTNNLKDQWPTEMILWGLAPYMDNISIKVKNTASKDAGSYDMIIIDEIHTCLSPEHGKVLDIPCIHLLGLTAKLPHTQEHRDIIELKAPVIYSKELLELVGAGIVPEFDMYNLSVSLTKSERARYKIFDAIFNKSKFELKKYISEYKLEGVNEFDLASEARANKAHTVYKPATSFWSSMSMRKWVCYRAENKMMMILNIIKKAPTKKWIVFSKETKFVDDLVTLLNNEGVPTVGFHSKMEKGAKIASLIGVKDPRIRVIVSAEALTTGYDLPDLDAAICASGVSTEILQVQMLGRISRWKDNKKPLFINLYSSLTQEETWVRNKTKDLNPTWINSMTKIKF